MKLYLDTGNLVEIKQGLVTGVIDGITTNPSLIAKEGVPFEKRIKEIVTLFKNENIKEFTVSAEVLSDTCEGMVKEGFELAKIDPHVVVKIPMTKEGIEAVRILAKEKIRTNVTLCFSVNQALLAAKAGAYIVSPFVGRLDDVGESGIALVKEIKRVYETYGFTTQVLAASIRSTQHVSQAADVKADIATIPFKIFEQLFLHPLTDIGIAKFKKDWEGYHG